MLAMARAKINRLRELSDNIRIVRRKDGKPTQYWETSQSPDMGKISSSFIEMLDQGYKNMKQILRSPFSSPEAIDRRQFQLVKELITTSYENVAFYRGKYQNVGFQPGDLKSWADYNNLPLTTKDELIEAFPDLCVNLSLTRDDFFATRSSGSSGRTLRIFVDPEAIVTDTLQGIRQFKLQSNGKYSKKHTIAHVYTVPWWIDSLKNNEYSSVFISSLISPKDIGIILDDVRPQILSLYPSNLSSILPYISERTKKRLYLTVTHSEMSSEEERRTQSERLGCPVLDEYSSEELTRIVLELPCGHYHICEDTTRLDLIDPRSKTPIDEGTGLVVATNLLNRAMPFIRYIQGDIITIGKQDQCEVHWKQIEKVKGRENDSFIRSDGVIIPSGTILDISYRWMFDTNINIQEFEIVQRDNKIIVNLTEPSLRSEEALDKSRAHLRLLLESVMGADFELDFNIVDKIEKLGIKRKAIRRE